MNFVCDSQQCGEKKSQHVMGDRVIISRTVRQSLVAKVVDPEPNPLRSHVSVDFPKKSADVRLERMANPQAKRRGTPNDQRSGNGFSEALEPYRK